jgi:aminopeptidase-like protein
MNLKSHFEKLGPLPRHINSPAYDEAAIYLSKLYGLRTVKLNKSHETNGWIIPPKYSVASAYIKDLKGNTVWDGLSHPLSVISYSSPVNKILSRNELLDHCHYDHRSEMDIPYHFRQSYRPWSRDWGFCMDKVTYDKLSEEYYQVYIETIEGESELIILEGETNPSSAITFVLAAHLDHPGQSNDDLSGVIAICEVFKNLPRSTGFNIKILIFPEIIGAELYLYGQRKFTDGLFVESVGHGGPGFYLQKPKVLPSCVPNICAELTNYDIQIVPFRHIFGNDEANFEGFGCPMCGLNRGYFSEYHTDKDNSELIDLHSMNEAISLVLDIVDRFKRRVYYKKEFRGTVCCANPKLSLYIEPGQPAFGTSCDSSELRGIMDAIPFMPELFSLDDLARCTRFNISEASIYLDKWCQLGLLTKLT